MSQESDKNRWIPPVNFYFRVVFQWGKHEIAASFMEVSGLDVEMETKRFHQAIKGDAHSFAK